MRNRVWGYGMLAFAFALVWIDDGAGRPLTWIASGTAAVVAVYLLAAAIDNR